MKKRILGIAFLLCVALMLPAAAQKAEQPKEERGDKMITRTYELKHVSSKSIERLARPYILEYGFLEGNPLITVTMLRENVKAFEDLLARLDRPKTNIHFRIFTVRATSGGESSQEDMLADLQGVVNELKKVLGYKSFTLDGVSSVLLADGSRYNELELNSHVDDLFLSLMNVNLVRSEDGKFAVNLGVELREKFNNIVVEQDRKVIDRKLIGVEQMKIQEGGYLVVGVSKMDTARDSNVNKMGDALVLVINATVQ